MRKKYKTWIQQLSESYIRNTLRENAISSSFPPELPPQQPQPQPQPEPFNPNPFPSELPPTATMSGTPPTGTPTPNDGPTLERIMSRGKRIPLPPPHNAVYEHEENGVVYKYYIGPPIFLVIITNGQPVPYFWGQNGWFIN